MSKFKINKKLLLNEIGFSVHARYSSDEKTDDIGRWARIIYFNGIQIAWINGYVKQDEMPIIENGRVGICNSFHVSPYFPTSSQGIVGYEKFDTIDESVKYVKDLFNDFIKTVSK
jgi:hypothetical protein